VVEHLIAGDLRVRETERPGKSGTRRPPSYDLVFAAAAMHWTDPAGQGQLSVVVL
jgi:hypothetical protein